MYRKYVKYKIQGKVRNAKGKIEIIETVQKLKTYFTVFQWYKIPMKK